MENILIAICAIVVVISYIGYRWTSKNVYLTYKDQRVGK